MTFLPTEKCLENAVQFHQEKTIDNNYSETLSNRFSSDNDARRIIFNWKRNIHFIVAMSPLNDEIANNGTPANAK